MKGSVYVDEKQILDLFEKVLEKKLDENPLNKKQNHHL